MSPTGVVKKIEQCPECNAEVEERVGSTYVRHRHNCSYDRYRSLDDLEAAIVEREQHEQRERDRMEAAVRDRFDPVPIADSGRLFMCNTCGAAVVDRERHVRDHERRDLTAKQASRADAMSRPMG